MFVVVVVHKDLVYTHTYFDIHANLLNEKKNVKRYIINIIIVFIHTHTRQNWQKIHTTTKKSRQVTHTHRHEGTVSVVRAQKMEK